MNLEKKRSLAARTLGVGRERVVFNNQRLDEIKEAITKQDIRDLVGAGSISVREIRGRKAVVRRKSRRGMGRVRKHVGNKKQIYMLITRKLRGYVLNLKDKKAISRDNYYLLRKEIRSRAFRGLAHLKERIQTL